MPERLSIAFQGTKSGLVIALDEKQPFQVLLQDLQRKLADSGSFFSDAKVTLQVGDRGLDENQLSEVRQAIAGQHKLRLTGVHTESAETQAAAEILGIPTLSAETPQTRQRKARESAAFYSRKRRTSHRTNDTLPTELLRTTIRSGQIYESPGHLVILGDVNSGAEVVSCGDIIVFGALRGSAFAGATGSEKAIIVANQLVPQILRIAQLAARPEEKTSARQDAEFAYIEQGKIVIDKWTNVNHLTFAA